MTYQPKVPGTIWHHGTRVHLHGDVHSPRDMGDVHTAWRKLQKVKVLNPDLQVISQLLQPYDETSDLSFMWGRSIFGADEVIVVVPPVPAEELVVLEHRLLSTPEIFPAIIAIQPVEEGSDEWEEVGFVTGQLPNSWRQPLVFWEVRRRQDLNHWAMGQWQRLYEVGIYRDARDEVLEWGEGNLPPLEMKSTFVSSSLLGGTHITDIKPAGHRLFEEPNYELISPVYGWSGVSFPYGTYTEEEWKNWTGEFEFYELGTFVINPGDPAVVHWTGIKPARHYGGEVYHTGICLADKVTQIWEGGPAFFGESEYGGVATPGDFSGALGLPWCRFFNIIDAEYLASTQNYRDLPANFAEKKTRPWDYDNWAMCGGPTYDPEEYSQTIPGALNVGYYWEFGPPEDWVGPGNRICTTKASSGGFVYSGRSIYFNRNQGIYKQIGLTDWLGGYYYTMFERDKITTFSRDFLEEAKTNWPWHLTSITKDCLCWQRPPPPSPPPNECDLIDYCGAPGDPYEEAVITKDISQTHAMLRIKTPNRNEEFLMTSRFDTVAHSINAGRCHPRYYELGDNGFFTGGAVIAYEGASPSTPMYTFRFDYLGPSGGLETIEFPLVEYPSYIPIDLPPYEGTRFTYVGEIPDVEYRNRPVYAFGPTRLVLTLKQQVIYDDPLDDLFGR